MGGMMAATVYGAPKYLILPLFVPISVVMIATILLLLLLLLILLLYNVVVALCQVVLPTIPKPGYFYHRMW